MSETVKKLTLLLKNETKWSLGFRALLTLLSLLFLRLSSFHLVGIIVFITASLCFYLGSRPLRTGFRVSFIFTAILAVLGAKFLAEPLSFAGLLVVYGAAQFALGGIALSIFNKSLSVYGLLHTGILLSYAFFIFEFGVEGGSLRIFTLLAFLGLYPIFFEMTRVFEMGGLRTSIMTSGALALLGSELALILTFIPLGSVNAAALLTMVFVIAREGLLAHHKGTFSLRFGLEQLLFFLFFLILIFASSKWSFWAL